MMPQKVKKVLHNRWFRRTAFFLLSWIAVHIIYISIDGLQTFKGEADVAVVLGNRVFADGRLSGWLQGRVDMALALYKEKRVKKIFASGGISTPEDGGYPEGDAMKQYLLNHGVPATDIISDNAGQNTFLTAKDFMEWNVSQHYHSVVIVSQFYHITRSKYIFKKMGCKNVASAASEKYTWADITGTLREVPAFYKYVLLY
jgi:vancomycin permeability regulator SanA